MSQSQSQALIEAPNLGQILAVAEWYERGERTAILTEAGAWSYRELARDVRARAEILGWAGAQQEAPTVLEVGRGIDSLIDLAALFSMGVPVVIAADGSSRQTLNELAIKTRASLVMSSTEQWRMAPPATPQQSAAVYLARATGIARPKVVPFGVEAILSFTSWAGRKFQLSDRIVLSFAPLSCELSLLEVWSTLHAGGTVVLAAEDAARNPARLRCLIVESGIDLIHGVPSLYQSLLKAGETTALHQVRDVIVAGGAAAAELRSAMVKIFPTTLFHSIYGSVETNSSLMGSFSPAEFAQSAKLPIGQPLECVDVVLLDDEQIVEGAGVGELAVSSPFMMMGTMSGTGSLLPASHPYAGYFLTGDLARRGSADELYLECREDRLVTISGQRVNLDELESCLASHPEVIECITVSRETFEGPEIIAVVQRKSESKLSALQLRASLSAGLPRQAVPAKIQWTDQPFPRTSSGQVDRDLVTIPIY